MNDFLMLTTLLLQFASAAEEAPAPASGPSKADRISLCMGPPYHYKPYELFKSCGAGWPLAMRDPDQKCDFSSCCKKEYKTCDNGKKVVRDPLKGCAWMACPSRRIEDSVPAGPLTDDLAFRRMDDNTDGDFLLCMQSPFGFGVDDLFKSCGEGPDDLSWGMVGRDPQQNCAFPTCCKKDVAVCPDGSPVLRDARRGCEFMRCPGTNPGDDGPDSANLNNPDRCGDDTHTCPDGSLVKADPNNGCRWKPCPNPCGDEIKYCPDDSTVTPDPENYCRWIRTCPDGSKFTPDSEDYCRPRCPPFNVVETQAPTGAPSLSPTRAPTNYPTECGPLLSTKCKTEYFTGQKYGRHYGFRPQCTQCGEYEPVQCDAYNNCWCVDEQGDECLGTYMTSCNNRRKPRCEVSRFTGKPVCPSRRRIDTESLNAPARRVSEPSPAFPETTPKFVECDFGNPETTTSTTTPSIATDEATTTPDAYAPTTTTPEVQTDEATTTPDAYASTTTTTTTYAPMTTTPEVQTDEATTTPDAYASTTTTHAPTTTTPEVQTDEATTTPSDAPKYDY